MHDYKALYLKMLHAASDAVTAMERMNFGAAKSLLQRAQQEAEEQWSLEEDTMAAPAFGAGSGAGTQ